MRSATVVFCVLIAGAAADEPSQKKWTVADFEARGKVVVGPDGETHRSFTLSGWNEPTLVDLRTTF